MRKRGMSLITVSSLAYASGYHFFSALLRALCGKIILFPRPFACFAGKSRFSLSSTYDERLTAGD